MKAPLTALIRLGIERLGVTTSELAVEQLAAYLQLLERWNRTYNLTAVRRSTDMVGLHILDSLAILPWLQGPRLLDVGSGAGLPGIPLAIVCRALDFVLLDSNGKRVRFMTQAVAELGLKNVSVVRCRAENYQPAMPFDSVVSRAYASLADMLHSAGRLCGTGGRLLAMKGVYPATELATLPPGFLIKGVYRLNVPELDAERHLVHLAPDNSPTRNHSWPISSR
ncbi:MAG: 16S rRNA (guanine(527)-N(7))-methyltransferase RsmG [Candidatus Competibacteraceae bacterium]|nr:16S rRNA (guanine(527)-N(7))-methyltransferase RsmG [Candidatus Competibacteraceae bacterium]